jgi:hypothetical protein
VVNFLYLPLEKPPKLKLQGQLIAEENFVSRSPMHGGVLARREWLQIAQAIVELIAVNVVQHEARQQGSVSFLVFMAMQRRSTVAEILSSVAEKHAAAVCSGALGSILGSILRSIFGFALGSAPGTVLHFVLSFHISSGGKYL